jgi:transposase
VGSPSELTKILALEGYRVTDIDFENEASNGRLWVHIERSGRRASVCSGCERPTSRRRDWKIRTWEDLPWAEHPVTLLCAVSRLRCPRCGVRTERLPFAAPKARVTRRLQTRIGLDCQSMPTSHAAVRHAVSWGRARRAEKAFLAAWDRSRPRHRPRHLGADEIQRGRGQRYWTVLSDLVRGEVIGLARDRTRAALEGLLDTAMDARQRAAVEAVCTDMHQPYVNAVAARLPHAEIVFDKFHVLQHASRAIDEVRRNEFFRAGPIMREYGRGKRWLLLRRWKNLAREKRRELQDLFAVNRRLYKAYVLREELDHLWSYATPSGVTNFLDGWIAALRWQRLPEMQKLGAFLRRHLDGIVAYCRHRVRFGVVEGINTTIKGILRRARGMRDERLLLLKLRWATTNPIRTAPDLRRFLSQDVHSNR